MTARSHTQPARTHRRRRRLALRGVAELRQVRTERRRELDRLRRQSRWPGPGPCPKPPKKENPWLTR